MKLYLYAPIAIAGFTAAVGAVSIANSEFGLFKSGQAVVAILKSQDQKPQTEDAMKLNFALDRGDARDIELSPAQMDFNRVASNDPLPTPEVSTEVAAVQCESSLKCEKSSKCEKSQATKVTARTARRSAPRLVREVRTIPLAPTATTLPTLTSYHFKDSDGFRFVVKGDGKNPVISLAGLPAKSTEFALSFDAKKFEAQKMKFASQMAKKHADQWQVFSEKDLKALQSFAMAAEFKAFDENGKAHIITLDPVQMAADAEKHKAACDAKDVDLDSDDQEIISSSQSK